MSSIDGKDAATRKAHPLFSGCLNYFPDALLELAKVSKAGNDQHNPGQPLHWSRDKSNDHLDCMARHLLDAGKFDTDGERHSAKLFWRAGANLQLELEAAAAEAAKPQISKAAIAALTQSDRRIGSGEAGGVTYGTRSGQGDRRRLTAPKAP